MEQVSWQEHRARYQGRVKQFDRRVRMTPPVADSGIDLWRGRSRGISGYEAAMLRRAREESRKNKVKEAIVRVIDEMPKWQETQPEPSTDPLHPTIDQIQWHVCKRAQITRNDLIGPCRTKPYIKPRHIAMMLSKMMTLRSLPDIGRRFNGRDHTTVLSAVRKTEEVQKYVLARCAPGDDIYLWVSAAFDGWEEAGL